MSRDSIPLSRSLTTITTDTGALAPGITDYRRFTTPLECLGAVHGARDMSLRSLSAQIAQVFYADSIAPLDTLSPSVVAVARGCIARFTVPGVAPADLADLFTLAIQARDDTIARAVIARRLALAPDAASRGTVLEEAVRGYLAARPARLATADSFAAQLDAMGTSVQNARIAARRLLLLSAMETFDEARMREEGEQIIALGQSVPAQTIQASKEYIFDAYLALAQLAYLEGTDSVMAVVSRTKQDLGRFGELPSGIEVPIYDLLKDFHTLTLARIRSDLLPFDPQSYSTKAAFPPIQASYWIPKAPASWPPGHGHLALIIYGSEIMNGCPREDGALLSSSLTNNECKVLYTYLPKWSQEFGDRLSITLVSQTAGYAVRSLVLSPAAEADTLAWFYREHLKLPVTVGLVKDSIWRLPAPDGRIFYSDTSAWSQPSPGNTSVPTHRMKPHSQDGDLHVLLYAVDGTPLYIGDLNTSFLQQLLNRTFGQVAQRTP